MQLMSKYSKLAPHRSDRRFCPRNEVDFDCTNQMWELFSFRCCGLLQQSMWKCRFCLDFVIFSIIFFSLSLSLHQLIVSGSLAVPKGATSGERYLLAQVFADLCRLVCRKHFFFFVCVSYIFFFWDKLFDAVAWLHKSFALNDQSEGKLWDQSKRNNVGRWMGSQKYDRRKNLTKIGKNINNTSQKMLCHWFMLAQY